MECAFDCESEEVCFVHVISALFIITSVTFRDMPLLLVDCTIQAVRPIFKNQSTFLTDRETRRASAEEEMLPHVAIRYVQLIIRLHFSLGTFNTCTSPI